MYSFGTHIFGKGKSLWPIRAKEEAHNQTTYFVEDETCWGLVTAKLSQWRVYTHSKEWWHSG